MARYLNGESNREIARQEQVDRATVTRILSRQEVAEMIARYQSQVLMMVPKAISAYAEVLESDDLRLKAATATKLLEGSGIFHREGIERAVEVAKSVDERREEERWMALGQIADLAIQAKQRNGVKLPPGMDAIEAEARKRLERTATSPDPKQ